MLKGYMATASLGIPDFDHVENHWSSKLRGSSLKEFFGLKKAKPAIKAQFPYLASRKPSDSARL